MGNIFKSLKKLEAALVSMATTAATAAETTKKAVKEIKEGLDETNDKLTRALGDLDSYLDKIKGPWADELRLQLDKVRLGGERIDDFVRKWGDWKILTENGVKTIREMLEGLDVKGFEDKLQGMIEAIHKGSGDTAKALELLREAGGALSAEFVAMVQQFQNGQVSLERVQAALEALKRVLGPNSAGADLAQALTNSLGQGHS